MKRLAFAALLAALVLAPVAWSFIPSGARIARATAAENRSAKRAQALRLELSLRVADREPIAKGALVTHPNGLARLELTNGGGHVERHLLVGTEHVASRDGQLLESPRAFLPPLFLLQAAAQLTLEQALLDYGMDPTAVALAPCEPNVCYVLGDPSRVPPPPPPTEEELAALAEEAEAGSIELEPAEAEGEMSTEPLLPRGTVWIDVATHEIVRYESATGVTVALGPLVEFGDVRFPGSLSITEPGLEPVHLEFERVTPVNAPAAEFGRAWLLRPPPRVPAQASPVPDAGPGLAPRPAPPRPTP